MTDESYLKRSLAASFGLNLTSNTIYYSAWLCVYNKASNPVNAVAYASNRSRWEAEAGRLLRVGGQPKLRGVRISA